LKKLFTLLCLFLCSCATGGPVLSVCGFYEVPIGATQEEMIAQSGDPVAIRRFDDGTIEYEFIERFKVGARILTERHYFILVRDGVVVSKRMKEISPTPFGYDSYEMQTTQKDQ
jgi:hypothetical protein